MPENTVSVARPTKWGNPFAVGQPYRTVGARTNFVTNADQAVSLYRAVAWTHKTQIVAALRGKNLACWCKPDAPCHADVLLEIANG